MNYPDLINGLFELFGGLFILLHCRRLFIDKEVKGASMVTTAFMSSWGLWNLYYYPSLGQWLSFSGGIMIVAANTLWVSMMLYYTYVYNTPQAMYRRSDKLLERQRIAHLDDFGI